MTEFIVLPGISGSDEAHWQSFWQRTRPAMRRFNPASWDQPDLRDWTTALEREVAAARTPPMLIVHSLSCLLVAHWQKTSSRAIKGAFLVAVPDPLSPVFPACAGDFANASAERLRFPSLIVASTNDPYGSLDYAKARAIEWGSEISVAGAFGHISSASLLGEWPTGIKLLTDFDRACDRRAMAS